MMMMNGVFFYCLGGSGSTANCFTSIIDGDCMGMVDSTNTPEDCCFCPNVVAYDISSDSAGCIPCTSK